MVELSKKTRKELRNLLIKAYGKELDQHLLELSKTFDAWKEKKITCWDLEEDIYKFHDGISRDLYNAYNVKSVDESYLIASALARKLLCREEIPKEAIDLIEHLVDNFFEQNE